MEEIAVFRWKRDLQVIAHLLDRFVRGVEDLLLPVSALLSRDVTGRPSAGEHAFFILGERSLVFLEELQDGLKEAVHPVQETERPLHPALRPLQVLLRGEAKRMKSRAVSAPNLSMISSGSMTFFFDLDIFSTLPIVTGFPHLLQRFSGVFSHGKSIRAPRRRSSPSSPCLG